MVGPLPPPNGGVANFVRNMRDILPGTGYEVGVYRTGGAGGGPAFVQPLRDMGAVLRFLATYNNYRTDIVHVHTSSYYSFLRNIPYVDRARRISRTGVIVHIHGGMFREFYDHASPPLQHLVRNTLGRADLVLVTSPSWIARIGEIAGPGTEVRSLANGFDSRTFRPADRRAVRRELGIPEDGHVLVTIGYLEPIKGHTYLIEAMAEVNKRSDRACLYILGNGSLHRKLAEQVRELGLEDTVRFVLEPMPSAGIARWMNASDVFVLPSLGEGNPTVMFESLGCGRPFVGTLVGGIPDVIDDRLGILCPPGDAGALARSILEALDRRWDPEEISTLAQRYSWSNLASQLSAIYDGLSVNR